MSQLRVGLDACGGFVDLVQHLADCIQVLLLQIVGVLPMAADGFDLGDNEVLVLPLVQLQWLRFVNVELLGGFDALLRLDRVFPDPDDVLMVYCCLLHFLQLPRRVEIALDLARHLADRQLEWLLLIAVILVHQGQPLLLLLLQRFWVVQLARVVQCLVLN